MKKLDAAQFLREVLAEMNELPEGFEQKLMQVVPTSPATRAARLRELFEEATRG